MLLSQFSKSQHVMVSHVLKTSYRMRALSCRRMAAKGWGAVSKQDTLDKYSIVQHAVCLIVKTNHFVGLVRCAFWRNFTRLQRLDSSTSSRGSTSPTQILSTHSSKELLAPMESSGLEVVVPLADRIAALDFHGSQFQPVFTWFDIVLGCFVD